MVTIYGKAQCSACDQAKMLLTKRGVDFEYKQLDKDYDMEFLMDKLEELGIVAFRTFPLIELNGRGHTLASFQDI
ncbi:putative glutaredoxin [Pseudomonas phage 16Q]|nr:putative glutaredoxin [Pseudomonas phage 16Q]